MPYPSDVSDEEWAFIAPYLTLLAADALQRGHDLRAVLNALGYLAHGGVPWRYRPHDFPPWPAAYRRARRWMDAGSFEAAVHGLRLLARAPKGRRPRPSAPILDARVAQSSPESGARAGYSGARRRTGAKGPAAVDTLGHPPALTATPASQDERTQVAALATAVREATGQHVEVAYVGQGYSGPQPAAAAAEQGIHLVVVKLQGAKRGSVPLPKRRAIERGFAWTARFRRLARDFERLPSVLVGLRFLAFACLMLHQVIHLYSSS
jgi:transposase